MQKLLNVDNATMRTTGGYYPGHTDKAMYAYETIVWIVVEPFSSAIWISAILLRNRWKNK